MPSATRPPKAKLPAIRRHESPANRCIRFHRPLCSRCIAAKQDSTVTVGRTLPIGYKGKFIQADLLKLEDNVLVDYAATRPEILAEPSQTQKVVLSLADRLKLTEDEIVSDLKKEKTAGFDKTQLFLRIFALANSSGARMPHAQLPDIKLNSPKITHGLTTSRFAKRVDERFHACLTRG